MRQLRITAGAVAMTAELNGSKTADLLWEALPLVAAANVWGDEIYFGIDVHTGEENPQAEVPSGGIAYWPPGNAFCIFFGQTPYSPVNLLGRLTGDPRAFGKVPQGETVRLEQV